MENHHGFVGKPGTSSAAANLAAASLAAYSGTIEGRSWGSGAPWENRWGNHGKIIGNLYVNSHVHVYQRVLDSTIQGDGIDNLILFRCGLKGGT